MSTELEPSITTAQAQQQAIREAWIEARVSEFANDPGMRDRALASILYDSLLLGQTVGEMMQIVRGQGLGGLIKAAMGAMKNGA